jgi:PTS system nitrogen regulatory IIA component
MYLNLVQVAESLGVSEKVVEDWIQNEGLPHVPDRGRILFDRTQVATWASARGLADKVGFLAAQNPVLVAEWRLEPLLRHGGIWRGVAASGLTDHFERILRALPGTTPAVHELLVKRLRSEHGITWAPIGGGFAIPHLSTRIALGREAGSIALLFLDKPLDCPEAAPDGAPVTHLFFFIAPSPRAHLDLLSRLARALSSGPLKELIFSGADDKSLYQAVAEADRAAADKKPGEHHP